MRLLRLTLLTIFGIAAALQAKAENFSQKLSDAAIERTTLKIRYDPAYIRIPYPNGDVPSDTGVCSDVVIRSLRILGIDLQKLIHNDMKANFGSYPNHWSLNRPDGNIDHRRVPNIETYLTRKGMRLPASFAPDDYQPGDIVAWNLKGNSGGWLPHIGIVTSQLSADGHPLIAHNIGAGPQLENVLFSWPISGRYRPIRYNFD